MQARSAGRLFAGVEGSVAQALERLGQASGAIEAAWRSLLRNLVPGRAEFEDLAGMRLSEQWRRLKESDYGAYAESLQRAGQTLASRGVPEEHAVVALAFHLESSLAELLRGDREERDLAVALARVASAGQRFVLAGYARARSTGWHRGEDQERKKLSRDLHDEVGADLVVLKLYIEMIALELGKKNPESARGKLEEALALVSHALDSVRRLTLDLGPAILEELGLVAAMKLYGRQFAARTGIGVRVEGGDLPPGLPLGHEATLYRVLQGALSNVAKHARARGVKVALRGVRGRVVVMVIEDDGVGFDVRRKATGSAFGLTTMRERIQGLGGRLHIESRSSSSRQAGSGTRIEIDLPVSQEGMP